MLSIFVCVVRSDHDLPGYSVSSRVAAWLHSLSEDGLAAWWLQVKLVTRFLNDTSLSGGSWLWICPTQSQQPTHLQVQQIQEDEQAAGTQQLLQAASKTGNSSSRGGSSTAGLFELVPAGSPSRRSSCDVEVVCSWRSLHSLTPDATQLAEHNWQPSVSDM